MIKIVDIVILCLGILTLLFVLYYHIFRSTTESFNASNDKLGNKIDRLMSSYGPIPKIIHVSWKNKAFVNKTQFSMIRNGIHNMKQLNPEYKFVISDDNDVEQYLIDHLDKSDYDLIKDRHIVEKVDLWRLLKMYHEGGVYIDIDRLCNIPLRDVIHKNTKCIIPIYTSGISKNPNKYHDFAQDIMISCPRNIFHEKTIELNLKRRREGERRIIHLGPETYLHAITYTLLGYECNYSDKLDACIDQDWDKLIAIIQKSPFLETYVEAPPFNTLLYRGPSINFDKMDFYKSENIKHWTH